MTRALRKRLQKILQTNEGMTRFLNDLFGVGQWEYDAVDDVWITPDKKYSGEGRAVLVIERGGSWTQRIIKDRALS